MRRRICLNGEWDFMPDYEGNTPEEAIRVCKWEGQKIRVPSSWRFELGKDSGYNPYDMFNYPPEWNKAQSGIIGRTLELQMEEKERAVLIFQGILQRFCIYINGQQVLESSESYLPVEVDVTDYINRDGVNEVKIWCGPYESISTETGSKQLAPCGSWFAQMARGLWQDVYLEYRPQTSIESMHIQTSTRRQTIGVNVDLVSRVGDCIGFLEFRIWNGNEIAKEFQKEIRLEKTHSITYSCEEIWAEAICWSPENPHLYVLETKLIIDGSIQDVIKTRFGFKEFWIEGRVFYLNGTRLNLRLDAWHYQGFVQQTKEYAENWYKMCKEIGINGVRLHAMPYPECYLEAADEVGMLIIDESAIYGSSKAIQADHPMFLENCRNHLKAMVQRDRNHPSVIIWSMQNEMRWVDGRDGYKEAMGGLVQEMRNLDPSRPISFDGDNRLVRPEDMEIISMHYNIDGTVESWDRTKPLIFGEHGKFHYISPQVGAGIGGGDCYLDFDRCMESLGMEEKLFLEYARKEEVNGLSPFNVVNYMIEAQPKEDIRLQWEDLQTPGVKPEVLKAYSMNIDNGLVQGGVSYIPNPAWGSVQEACRPVGIIGDDYNICFYGETRIQRAFSIYNDTEHVANAQVVYRLVTAEGDLLQEGRESFTHIPGERKTYRISLELPAVEKVKKVVLQMELFHEGQSVDILQKQYKLYPSLYEPLEIQEKKAAFLGNVEEFYILSQWIKDLSHISECIEEKLQNIQLLIIGRDCKIAAEKIQPILQKYVCAGGFVLVLEQTSFTLGDVTLSGKKFFNTHICDHSHPVFQGIEEEDLGFWDAPSIYDKQCRYMIQNGFSKPEQGDVRILLECGEGDFGWGGLLWTPMLEYAIGKGRVLMSQIQLLDLWETVPPAGRMLKNLLAYGLAGSVEKESRTGTCIKDPVYTEFLDGIGVLHTSADPSMYQQFSHMIVDLKYMTEKQALQLKDFAESGGTLLILPTEPSQSTRLQDILGVEVQISYAPVYQVKGKEEDLTKGISPYDLYHFERVTYSPGNKRNSMICQYAIESSAGEAFLENVKNPWHEFFGLGRDGEPVKIAIAAREKQSPFIPAVYGRTFTVGKGRVVICQILPNGDSDKIKRVYTRILRNAGYQIHTRLLGYIKEEADHSIEYLMALPKEKHQSYEDMEAYFRDENYILNNLGEGVYGWMKRLEKKNGYIEIPNSKGRTYFLTTFIESDINRNPLKRENNQLPDSSIVPDLYMQINSPFKLFVNGHCYMDASLEQKEERQIRIEDIILNQGINRMALVCNGESEDIRLNICFKNKYGDYVDGLKYYQTLD